MKRLLILLLVVVGFVGCKPEVALPTEEPEKIEIVDIEQSDEVEIEQPKEDKENVSETETKVEEEVNNSEMEEKESESETEIIEEKESESEIIEEPKVVLDAPIIKFVGSNLYDYSDKFTIECTNYEIGLNTIDSSRYCVSIYYTKDGSDPLNSSTNLQYDNRNNFISNKSDAGTSTIKAVAILSCGLENLCYSEIIEQTFIRKEYQVKFTSKIDYKYLPNNFTTYKTHYQPRYIPIEGYNLKGFKVGNIEYECGDKIEISKDTTIEYLWIPWRYPCILEKDIPDNYTKITESDSPFETFKFIYDYKTYKLTIKRVNKYFAGNPHTSFTGTLEVSRGNYAKWTYNVQGGFDESDVHIVKLTDTYNRTYLVKMYVNCNQETDYFNNKRQLYVNLSDFENL